MSMKREPESEPLLSNGVGTNQQNRKIPPRFMDNQPPTDYDLGIKKRYPEPLSLQFRLTTVIGYVVGSKWYHNSTVFALDSLSYLTCFLQVYFLRLLQYSIFRAA